jgi:predicted Zn-dependent protease
MSAEVSSGMEGAVAGEREFAATGFAPGYAGTGVKGLLRVTADGVRFESEHGALELPLAGLEVFPGGANDALICFSHGSHPGTMFQTGERSVTQHPALVGNGTLVARLRVSRRRARGTWVVMLGIAGMIVTLIAGLVLSKDWIVKKAAESLPVDWEVTAGDALFEPMRRTQTFVEDEEIAKGLQQITEPLIGAVKDRRHPLRFHVVLDESLNAYAMPGGNVVIHTGLLLAAETPEEVAGVLAHEIAHVTHRHGVRNMIGSAGLALAVQTMFGDGSGLAAVLADRGAFLLDRKYSRDFEREADEAGWNYLLSGNIEPRGMIRFFERMKAEDAKRAGGATAGRALSAISTHPATQERIDALEARWGASERKMGYRTFDMDYAAFKKTVAEKAKQNSASK